MKSGRGVALLLLGALVHSMLAAHAEPSQPQAVVQSVDIEVEEVQNVPQNGTEGSLEISALWKRAKKEGKCISKGKIVACNKDDSHYEWSTDSSKDSIKDSDKYNSLVRRYGGGGDKANKPHAPRYGSGEDKAYKPHEPRYDDDEGQAYKHHEPHYSDDEDWQYKQREPHYSEDEARTYKPHERHYDDDEHQEHHPHEPSYTDDEAKAYQPGDSSYGDDEGDAYQPHESRFNAGGRHKSDASSSHEAHKSKSSAGSHSHNYKARSQQHRDSGSKRGKPRAGTMEADLEQRWVTTKHWRD